MILALQGLPGSGKTTFRVQWIADDPSKRTAINYDEIRQLIRTTVPDAGRWAQEDEVKRIGFEMARKALEAGLDLCIDNTNLNERRLEPWRQLATEFNVPFEVRRIDTPVHVCIDQDRERMNPVGRAVIEGMALRNGFLDLNNTALYTGEFVIVDVDGTVANLDHRQKWLETKCLNCGRVNPARSKDGTCGAGLLDGQGALKPGNLCGGEVTKKDWRQFFRECEWDAPINSIINLVDVLQEHYTILIVSGRPDDQCGLLTERWLADQGINYEHLFMRRGGDFRDDTEVKAEILSFLPKKNIAFVLDDRDRVVKMWRDNGIKCLQVAPGDF